MRVYKENIKDFIEIYQKNPVAFTQNIDEDQNDDILTHSSTI